ncbi:MAG: DEAD/DEAH box helicase [Christensenellales bacterium]
MARCLHGGEDEQGLYTLTVPTGGGKTISSLAFALSHAVKHDLQRVIYVIPYTSIIEQNADVFAKVLGEENVLEHHSQVEFADDGEETPEAYKKRLACENWDAPVVVTTAVQFLNHCTRRRPRSAENCTTLQTAS